MKKLLLSLLTINCFGQAPTVSWQNCYGGSKNEEARCVKPTPDGGFIVAGYTFSNDGQVTNLHGTIEDFWIVKLSVSGSVEWQKAYGGDGDEEAYSIILTNDGGYVVAGYATYPNSGDVTGIHSSNYREDFWVIKLSGSGNLEWQKTYGGTMNEVAKDIRQTADGGYVLIGTTLSNDFDVSGLHGTYHDAWVLKLSATGTIEWQKCYGGSTYEHGNAIVQSNDGGYVFTGSARSSDGDLTGLQEPSGYEHMWVVKINNVGVIEWQKIIPGGGEGYKVITTSNGEYLILCSASSSGTSVFLDSLYGYNGILKLNATGDVIWGRTYGENTAGLRPGNLIQASDGNYVFSATISSAAGDVTEHYGQDDIWLVKVDQTNGGILWQKTVGRADASEIALYLAQSNDNGYIVSGTAIAIPSFPGHYGLSDYFVAKLSPDGLSINDFNPYQLAIYPNPGKDVINIDAPDTIIMDKYLVTDMTGKIVISQTERTNQIFIGNLSNGMYFLQAFSGGIKYQSKFIKE